MIKYYNKFFELIFDDFDNKYCLLFKKIVIRLEHDWVGIPDLDNRRRNDINLTFTDAFGLS